MKQNKKMVFIHRAKIEKNSVENTLLYIVKCLNKGYALELDVRLLKDNTIVIFHDLNLKRLTGINRNIENYTYIKVKNKYQIPTLKFVLNIVNGSVPVLIDVKGNINNYKLEDELLRLLKNYNGIIYIQSFQVRSLNYMWKINKNYKYGLIVLNNIHLKLYKKLWIKFCSSFVSCHLSSVKSKYMQKVRKNKLLLGWTITNRKDINQYDDYCDHFICENIE